jgi:hypothetical protein
MNAFPKQSISKENEMHIASCLLLGMVNTTSGLTLVKSMSGTPLLLLLAMLIGTFVLMTRVFVLWSEGVIKSQPLGKSIFPRLVVTVVATSSLGALLATFIHEPGIPNSRLMLCLSMSALLFYIHFNSSIPTKKQGL